MPKTTTWMMLVVPTFVLGLVALVVAFVGRRHIDVPRLNQRLDERWPTK